MSNESVRPITPGQLKDVITAVVGGIPNDLTFDEAKKLGDNKGTLVSKIREVVYHFAGRNMIVVQPEPKSILSKLATVNLRACKGKRTFVTAKKLFKGYFDPDFEKYKTNKSGKATGPTPVVVCQLDVDSTNKQIFTSPQTMWMEQDQILAFIEDHRDQLRTEGYATLFLIKVEVDGKEEYFVVRVGVGSGVTLGAYVRPLDCDLVWDAKYRYRVVFPATVPSTP